MSYSLFLIYGKLDLVVNLLDLRAHLREHRLNTGLYVRAWNMEDERMAGEPPAEEGPTNGVGTATTYPMERQETIQSEPTEIPRQEEEAPDDVGAHALIPDPEYEDPESSDVEILVMKESYQVPIRIDLRETYWKVNGDPSRRVHRIFTILKSADQSAALLTHYNREGKQHHYLKRVIYPRT